jgi:predicted dinucleotide-binding enzyme
MKIAVLGTGPVGRTLSARLLGLGHQVVMGTRDPEVTHARGATGTPTATLTGTLTGTVTGPGSWRGGTFADWQAEYPAVELTTFAKAAATGEVVVNAIKGSASLDVLEQAGSANLAGKVIIDVANALDASGGFPPRLTVQDTDSLAEQIQRAFPEARVVKTLNTVTAPVMVEPGKLEDESSVFVSGNDPAAKRLVTELLLSFGHTDVIDLGDISSARGAEMVVPLWLRLMATFGTPMFNFKVVR